MFKIEDTRQTTRHPRLKNYSPRRNLNSVVDKKEKGNTQAVIRPNSRGVRFQYTSYRFWDWSWRGRFQHRWQRVPTKSRRTRVETPWTVKPRLLSWNPKLGDKTGRCQKWQRNAVLPIRKRPRSKCHVGFEPSTVTHNFPLNESLGNLAATLYCYATTRNRHRW